MASADHRIRLDKAEVVRSAGFIDYLALALTTATAFSPTDTMPNSQRAKALMSTQGLISLITLGLIISRAVGILQ